MSKFSYLMGLVGTDGYAVKYKDRITHVEIECTEQELLQKISQDYNIDLKYRNRIIKDKLRHFWRVNLKNIIPLEYLTMFDKHRSNLDTYYKTLKNNDINDFILGIWDGDGSICKRATGVISANIIINSETKSIINIIEDFLIKNDIKFSKYFDKRGVGCYNYQIYKECREKFFNLLYSNKDLYCIERKKKMAMELLNQ